MNKQIIISKIQLYDVMTIQTTNIIDKKINTKNDEFNSKLENSIDEKLTNKIQRSLGETILMSEQLTDTVAELENATKSQTSGIEEVSQSIQSIAMAIQGVASNAIKTMEMMKQSEQITRTIGSDAEKGMSKMNSMKSIVSESSNDVKKLAKELSKVDNMTEFITQIAEQTNLLALNAAIEAARAGDVGRGFAVVAEEVRRLAENSKKGAEEISEIISSLKESSDKTTISIEKGNIVVQDAYDVITNILNSIKGITTSITEVVSQMQEISAATEQVSSGTEEATAASEEILSVAQTNLKSFEDIVSAKDKETQTLQNTNKNIKILTDIVDSLDLSTMISISDIDGIINYSNKSFLDSTKLPLEEIYGERYQIIKSGWHDDKAHELLWKTISNGNLFQGYFRNRAKDGSIFWVKTSITPKFDENHNIQGYVHVDTPITELMILTGIEEACLNIENGKPVKPHLKKIVEQLKTGNIQCSSATTS
ncbi:Methyl-accepting chemotaxis protein [metagenome]